MKLSRRQSLRLATGVAALSALPSVATAQAYPSRAVTIIDAFAPGGNTDFIARIVGQHMSRTLGQQFIVENIGGAGGTIGSVRAMRAKPDGYTIQVGHTGTHAFSVAFYPNLPYKPDLDFEPIGLVAEQPLLIVARKDFPPKDLREFIAYVKTNVEKLNVAHAGVGSLSFTFGLLLNSMMGVKPTLVPFNGAGPALNALVGGQVDYMCASTSSAGQQVQSGLVKAYAIGAVERYPTVPNVPTSVEAGLPEFQALVWIALFAPKQTPRSILDKLTDALDQALDDQYVRKRLFDIGCDVPGRAKRGQQPLAALVKSEIARWTPILKGAI